VALFEPLAPLAVIAAEVASCAASRYRARARESQSAHCVSRDSGGEASESVAILLFLVD